LYFYFFAAIGRPYRMIGWMFVVPLGLFLYTQARSYYFAPAYPMLFAGGAVMAQQWLEKLSTKAARAVQGGVLGVFALGGLLMAPIALPLVPVESQAWSTISDVNGELNEMIGWPNLSRRWRAHLSGGRRKPLPAYTPRTAGAGAINLFGPHTACPNHSPE
jgi:hypothetical protein